MSAKNVAQRLRTVAQQGGGGGMRKTNRQNKNKEIQG